MRILYYDWNENSKMDMVLTLQILGHEVDVCQIPFQNHFEDVVFTETLREKLRKQKYDFIFSFDFFPLIAMTAEKEQIKYVSWIYDAPHWTLYAPIAASRYNYIFLFDREQYQVLQERNIPHLYHFSLAVNTERLERQIKMDDQEMVYENDICFIGSLYESNLYDQIGYLPERLKGYLEGIMNAQEKVYGYNFVPELLTDSIIQEFQEYVTLNMESTYRISARTLYADVLNKKITAMERKHVLKQLSQFYPVTLYTASDLTDLPEVKGVPPISYKKEMPEIFHHSMINLNITSRGIASGIPLRALDIMGAGGFLLSNYQPELAEAFENGEELVMYGSQEELMELTAYYLQEEEERKEIAQRGFERAKQKFSYVTQVTKMLAYVFEE